MTRLPSPVEAHIVDGNLYLEMVWLSRKAQDLLRNPRCTVHITVSNRDGNEGEFKLYGRAIDVQDAAARRRYCQALTEKIGEGPGEEDHYHLFSVDIESTAFGIIEDGERWFAGFEGARPAERPPGTMIPGTG